MCSQRYIGDFLIILPILIMQVFLIKMLRHDKFYLLCIIILNYLCDVIAFFVSRAMLAIRVADCRKYKSTIDCDRVRHRPLPSVQALQNVTHVVAVACA